MNYEVVLSHRFERDFKKLKRNYKSIKTDVTKAIDLVENNPEAGLSLGNGLHKLRISISSKTSGKSGGGRIVYYFRSNNGTILFLTIYDKSNLGNISKEKLIKMLKDELIF